MTHTLCADAVLTATHRKKRSIVSIPKIRNGQHPTQKPVALMEYMVETYTDAGDSVLDFVMGSGTTGVACVKTGRKFVGIELDRGYFDIAVERISKAIAERDAAGAA